MCVCEFLSMNYDKTKCLSLKTNLLHLLEEIDL